MNIAQICRHEVHHVSPREGVLEAAARMRECNVGTLIVTDTSRHPIGIVTDRDLALRVLGEGRDPARTHVEDVMTSHPQALTPETSLEEAHAIMRRLGVRRMPVVGSAGELTGLVSVDDLLAQLAATLEDLSQIVAHSAAGVTPPAPVPTRRGPARAGLERASSDSRP